MTTRDELVFARGHPNVAAFLHVLRAGESSQDDTAYRMIYGGELIDSLDKHPRIPKQTPWGWTSAAGAYQFMAAIPGKVKTDTWDGLERKYGPLDFSPETQDLMAVALIDRRGALVMVMEGRIQEAIQRCAREWASLPGSPYGQPTISMDKALAIYLEYGGAPHEDLQQSTQETQQEKPMAPIVIPLLQAAAQLIPALGSLFGSGSEVANRNIAAGKVVADTLVQATQAINLQEAVERIQNDPRALQAARSAVTDVLPSIMESGGGGIDGARKAALAPDQLPFWKQGAFYISLILTVMPFMLLTDAFFIHPDAYDGNLRTQIVTGVMLIISIVGAFWLGSTFGSQKKDSMLGGRQ